jgi:N6-adenosine-specific RNA methylase IME4
MMLRETPRNKGEAGQFTGSSKEVPPAPPTLSELGIDKKISSLSQKIANLTDEEFEKVRTGTTIARAFKEHRKKENLEKMENIPNIPDDIYQVIYTDPPWQYNDKQNTDNLGGAEKHYPTMSIEELCEMKIPKTKDNAVLFLWTTAPILEESFDVINSWGFRYKAHFIWDKVKHNMGHYNSVRHELLLIATKGSCLPDNIKLFDSVQTIEKTKKHSEKPIEFYEIIETLYKGKKVELFARNKREGWDSWGNE